MAMEHHPIWSLSAYSKVKSSCYNMALRLLQPPQFTNAPAISYWWRDLHDSQARVTIFYQERWPTDRTGKPIGLTQYTYCNHWVHDLWYSQTTKETKLPTQFYLVKQWHAIGMVPFLLYQEPEFTDVTHMAAA